METIKEANKFSFGIGIFLFLIFGFTILLSGFEAKSTIGFLIGIYNLWQHGFVNDSSKWKIKPKLILIISVFILLSAYVFLNFKRSSNSENKSITSKDIIEQVEIQARQELPKPLGDNGDSIIKILAINGNTLEYLYKMNLKITDLDSATLKSFESDTRVMLIGNMKKIDPTILNEYRKNKMIFKHKYADLDGTYISIVEINPSDY
jgi:hypothetical protein